MLTPKQEKFCQNIEAKKMTQRQAYIDAYPKAAKWKPANVDSAACNLTKIPKISARLKEIRDSISDDIRQEAKWTREDAFNNLDWLITKAKEEVEATGEVTSPCVSALIGAVKELNVIYAVGNKTEGQGVLDDILAAVKGVKDD